jgi:hypothetical protein
MNTAELRRRIATAMASLPSSMVTGSPLRPSSFA